MMEINLALAGDTALMPTLSTPATVEHRGKWKTVTPCIPKTSSTPSNQLLAALPAADYERLSPHLQPALLRAGQVLCTPSTPNEGVHFLSEGLVSAVVSSDQGLGAEIVAVGHEGMVGNVVCKTGGITGGIANRGPFRYASVHMGGCSWWLPMHVLQAECERGGAVRDLILGYAKALRREAHQIAKCKHSHETVARLSHWLLVLRERAQTDELPLTQETIAGRLDVTPNEAILASGLLWSEKLIRFNPTHITILDHKRLRDKACDCSAIIHHKRAAF